MIKIAQKYHSLLLSVIPVSENKIPIGSWKKNISELIPPNGNFDTAYGIGICCGIVSGGLTAIDIDEKYSLDGKLFLEYKKLINEIAPDLLKKMVVEKTPSGGHHLFFRCSETEGNLKLANRYTTDAERKINPKEKVKVLLETRCNGGFTMVFPSPNYTMVYGSFDTIQEITPQERKILFDCAKTFNEVYDKPIIKKEYTKIISDNISPFDDYNNRGDVLQLLESEGWKITLQRGTKNLLLRPGGTGKWSADFDNEKRLFYVWTSSSQFENGRAYNPTQVLTILRFKGDYSESAKWLLKNGYGKFEKPKEEKKSKATIQIKENDFSYALKTKDVDEYLTQARKGTLKMGLSTGFPELDEHFRFKENSLVVINGHDNTGKSVLMWFLFVISAKLHGWKWIIHAAENKSGGVIKRLMEFSSNQSIRNMSDEVYEQAKKWVDEHFIVIDNSENYTYVDLLLMAENLIKEKQYQGLLIDPYNSLHREKDRTENVHDYDYQAMGDMRIWIRKHNCCIYINTHAQTEALRRTYPMNHAEYAGMPMPPNKADTEGGGKFSNRADDFLTIHRMTQHATKWMFSEIHVRKIKEMETGGRPTSFDKPFIVQMGEGGCGFNDMSGYNPIKPSEKFYSTKPLNFHESTKKQTENEQDLSWL